MVGALLIGEGNYSILINIATIRLIACALVALKPAAMLDWKTG